MPFLRQLSQESRNQSIILLKPTLIQTVYMGKYNLYVNALASMEFVPHKFHAGTDIGVFIERLI